MYSSVPNRRACTFINFEEKIPPARPYLALHVYCFWEKNPPARLFFYVCKGICPARLLILRKKNPPCTALFGSARLMFFKNFPTCTFIWPYTSIRHTRVVSYNLDQKKISKSKIHILPNYEQTDLKTAIVCVVDTSYGLGRSLGVCRPALPKGRKYQMVKTQTESHDRRPIVWTNRWQIWVSFSFEVCWGTAGIYHTDPWGFSEAL